MDSLPSAGGCRCDILWTVASLRRAVDYSSAAAKCAIWSGCVGQPVVRVVTTGVGIL